MFFCRFSIEDKETTDRRRIRAIFLDADALGGLLATCPCFFLNKQDAVTLRVTLSSCAIVSVFY